MKQITYYTPLKWWKYGKECTPKGYTFKVIYLDKPVPKVVLGNTATFRAYSKIKGWKNPHYIGDYKDMPSTWRGRFSSFAGGSVTRSFVDDNKYVCWDGKSDHFDTCTKRKKGARPQWIYTPQHENLHRKTFDMKKPKALHKWIALGKYDVYEKEYLDTKPKSGMLPLIKRQMDSFVNLVNTFHPELNIRVTSTYRSIAEQDKLYAQGRTTPGDIVTNAKGGESFHNWGVAFDIVDRKKGYNISDKEWKWMANLWKALTSKKGVWGGSWISFVDKPHFQNTLGYKLKDFQQGKVDYTLFN